MIIRTRHDLYKELYPAEPAFRWQQIEAAFFGVDSWPQVTTISKTMRERLTAALPWVSYDQAKLQSARNQETHKAALAVSGGEWIETVLMRNAPGQWTICVSSQIGCAMGCNFCLTGTMGFRRNLTCDEIVDQYRFWQTFLRQRGEAGRISNLVVMGMGEPMLNYEAVRDALRLLLRYTDIGPTHITVSSVGVMAGLNKLLADPDWPPVRLAISLHSADPVIRRQLIPTSTPDFLKQLITWAKKYEQQFGNRRHYLTFEYIMINGINDAPAEAAKLARFVNAVGHAKVNLISYNLAKQPTWRSSTEPVIRDFMVFLENHGVTVTRRQSMGEEIKAACGQLVTQ